MITPLYAALFGFMYVFLSIRVIKNRRALSVAIGDGNNNALSRVVRAHGNFSEYVPFTLILLFLFEIQTQSSLLVHLLGISLLIGRLIHAYGLSQVNENIRLRVMGMVSTFMVIIVLCSAILFSYLY
ncbi:MAG: MAPEG family protein [Arenicella sp.]